MRTITVVILIVVLFIMAGFIIFWSYSGPDLKSFEHLREPQISTMKSQKMITIELKGDPNATAGKAIRQLYPVFYQLKNNHIKQAAPRARWPIGLEVKKGDWIGIYGLPVSGNITELPKQKNKATVKLIYWEYGTVAEILHIGPYSTETPTIIRLKNYIAAKGYQIIGDHEEEYLKGPGLWPTDPRKFYTIIRYRIRQK